MSSAEAGADDFFLSIRRRCRYKTPAFRSVGRGGGLRGWADGESGPNVNQNAEALGNVDEGGRVERVTARRVPCDAARPRGARRNPGAACLPESRRGTMRNGVSERRA